MSCADALQIGTALCTDQYSPVKIRQGFNDYLDRNGMRSVTELTGTVITG